MAISKQVRVFLFFVGCFICISSCLQAMVVSPEGTTDCIDPVHHIYQLKVSTGFNLRGACGHGALSYAKFIGDVLDQSPQASYKQLVDHCEDGKMRDFVRKIQQKPTHGSLSTDANVSFFINNKDFFTSSDNKFLFNTESDASYQKELLDVIRSKKKYIVFLGIHDISGSGHWEANFMRLAAEHGPLELLCGDGVGDTSLMDAPYRWGEPYAEVKPRNIFNKETVVIHYLYTHFLQYVNLVLFRDWLTYLSTHHDDAADVVAKARQTLASLEDIHSQIPPDFTLDTIFNSMGDADTILIKLRAEPFGDTYRALQQAWGVWAREHANAPEHIKIEEKKEELFPLPDDCPICYATSFGPDNIPTLLPCGNLEVHRRNTSPQDALLIFCYECVKHFSTTEKLSRCTKCEKNYSTKFIELAQQYEHNPLLFSLACARYHSLADMQTLINRYKVTQVFTEEEMQPIIKKIHEMQRAMQQELLDGYEYTPGTGGCHINLIISGQEGAYEALGGAAINVLVGFIEVDPDSPDGRAAIEKMVAKIRPIFLEKELDSEAFWSSVLDSHKLSLTQAAILLLLRAYQMKATQKEIQKILHSFDRPRLFKGGKSTVIGKQNILRELALVDDVANLFVGAAVPINSKIGADDLAVFKETIRQAEDGMPKEPIRPAEPTRKIEIIVDVTKNVKLQNLKESTERLRNNLALISTKLLALKTTQLNRLRESVKNLSNNLQKIQERLKQLKRAA